MVGISFDSYSGKINRVRPEPLDTVYRDSSTEWGMVAFDITDPKRVSYGIVGFRVCNMTPNPNLTGNRIRPRHGRRLQVMDEHRPRKGISALEYMAKFQYEDEHPRLDNTLLGLLSDSPLIDPAALDYIWPRDMKDIEPPASPCHTNNHIDDVSHRSRLQSLKNMAFETLVNSTFTTDHFDMSVFDHVRNIPDFSPRLWHHLVANADHLKDAKPGSLGQLIGLACSGQHSLELELLGGIPAQALATSLAMPELQSVRSINLCVSKTHSTPKEMVDALTSLQGPPGSLYELNMLQVPSQADSTFDALFLAELCARPDVLCRFQRIMFASSYSAALRKCFWLPTSKHMMGKDGYMHNVLSSASTHIFPVQQMLVRRQAIPRSLPSDQTNFLPSCYHLGDALLGPKSFVAAFVLYLRRLALGPSGVLSVDNESCFIFSRAPTSLLTDYTDVKSLLLAPGELNHIPAENFAIPIWVPSQSSSGNSYGGELHLWPRTRDLVPHEWTVVVSSEMHLKSNARERRPPSEARFLRYAFLRPRHGRIINIHSSPNVSLVDLERDLEVASLHEFVRAVTAPGEIDKAILSRRLDEVASILASQPDQPEIPSGMDRLSVFEPSEATEVLLGFLEDARSVDRRLRAAMEDAPEGKLCLLHAPSS